MIVPVTNTSRSATVRLLGKSLAVLFLMLCGPLCTDRRPRTDPQARVSDLRYYVETLSSARYAGRASGSPEGHAAAQFIAEEHRRNALVPGFGSSFVQEFPFMASEVTVSPGRNFFHLTLASGETEKIAVLPLPLSRPGTFRGPVVFGGYCIDAGRKRDDFAGLRVKDTLVVCLRFGPGGKANVEYQREISFVAKLKAAERRGARAVIFVGRKSFAAPSIGAFPARDRPGPAAVYVEPEALLRFLPNVAAAEKAAQANQPLPATANGQLRASGAIETHFTRERLTGRNVAAFIRQPAAGDRLVIVGAHLDHIGRGEFGSVRGAGQVHPGADDNASGTAALLELAASLRSQEVSLPRRINVLFVHFDAEERGLLGSRAFVKSKAFSPATTVAMVNLDMVGRLGAAHGLSLQGFDTADGRFETAIKKAIASASFDTMIAKLRRGGRGPSDHTSFYEKRVPVLFLTTGAHREYHTSDDRADLVQYGGLLSIVKLTGALVQQLALLDKPLVFRESGAASDRVSFRSSLRLGIVPAGYGESGGVEVGSVQAGAPVAATGLRSGDRVVSLGGKPIGDIHDLMDFLIGAKPNVEYAIEFTRGRDRRVSRTRLMGP